MNTTPSADFGELASTAWREAHFQRRQVDSERFAAHEQRVQHDLACLNFPPANWVPQREGILDVLVVGAGMCGQTAAFALLKDGVRNLRIIDREQESKQGPWDKFARMEILRSPKHLTGPDLGVGSLTFRAWYEARFGNAEWEALHKVYRLDWRDYLLWVRKSIGLPVESGVALTDVQADGGLLRVSLQHANRGKQETIRVRKLVLAMGREGSGDARLPSYESLNLEQARASGKVFHSMDAIDFTRFKGKHIGVLGIGASAFDNAAWSLEAGARVTMFARRAHFPQVNKSKWTSFMGFFKGYAALSDEQRWRIYTYIFDEQVPAPYESVLRCDRHAGFEVRMNETWLDVALASNGVSVKTPAAEYSFDAVIFGTGFDVNLQERPELAAFAPHVQTWQDRVDALPFSRACSDATRTEAGRFPYLSEEFQLQPRSAQAPDELRHIYLFNWGSTMSQGAVGGDIPGLAHGTTKLSAALARSLFLEDADTLERQMHALTEPELKPTRFYRP